jgi:hypothetical protein
MKKLASILGISAISMAVALTPAFAQQTNPQGPAGTAAVQPKSDVKVPAKPMGDVKTDKDKSTADKTGSDVKSEAVPGKPAPDVKAGTAPAKTGTAVKNKKGSNVKPGANLKSDHAAKSNVHSKAVAKSKHHAKKSSQKPASRMHAKAHVS